MKIESVYSSFGGFEISNLVKDIKEVKGNFFAYGENNELIYELRSKEVVVKYFPGQVEKKEPKKRDLSEQFADDCMELTDRFKELLLFNNPKVSIPKDLGKWYKEMEAILRLDGLSYQEALTIIEYSQTSDFWKSIVLSVQKLRQKKDTLLSQATQKVNSSSINKLKQLAGEEYGQTRSSQSDFFTFD